MVGPTTPLVVAYCRPPTPIAVVYFTESAKNASSAVIRFRRSDFIEARYAFSFVFANFGIAIAAKMPMITTTIRSSISVKPLRFIWTTSPVWYNNMDVRVFRAIHEQYSELIQIAKAQTGELLPFSAHHWRF